MPQGERSVPLGEYPEGVSPSGRFFGDFLIGEKVTRGAEHGKAMLSRSACRWVQGLPAPQKPPGRGAERSHKGGVQRGAAPRIPPPGGSYSAISP